MNKQKVYLVKAFDAAARGHAQMCVLASSPLAASESGFKMNPGTDLVEVWDHLDRLALVVDGSRALAADDLMEGRLAYVVSVTDQCEVFVMESRQGPDGCDQRRQVAQFVNLQAAARWCVITQAKILGWVTERDACFLCSGFGGTFQTFDTKIMRWCPCVRCNSAYFSED